LKTLKQRQIAVARQLARFGTTLKQRLIQDGRTRWLDVGSGYTFDEGFEYLDWFPPEKLPPELASRYHQGDILEISGGLASLGTFDLVRMQHVFEHFSFEEGLQVLKSCGRLLKKDGFLLITVPDLRIYVKSFLRNRYNKRFSEFARTRLPSDAPSSCYFSVFAHSFGYSPLNSEDNQYRSQHKWCYDYEGVSYQLQRSGEFKNIKQLTLFNPLASIPFTHNRPEEDLCVLSQKA